MKQAQFKIQEIAFMLMAVTIFLIIAGLFFVVVKYRGLYREANRLERERVISLIAKLSDTAEFSCGKRLCIDADKLIVMQNRKSYEGFWPLKSLSVKKIGEEKNIECNKKNYPNCNFFKIYEEEGDVETVSTFVSLCRKEQEEGYWYNKCEIGKIIAGIEIKQIKGKK